MNWVRFWHVIEQVNFLNISENISIICKVTHNHNTQCFVGFGVETNPSESSKTHNESSHNKLVQPMNELLFSDIYNSIWVSFPQFPVAFNVCEVLLKRGNIFCFLCHIFAKYKHKLITGQDEILQGDKSLRRGCHLS